MDLATHDDFYRPHPNFDDGINRAICQSEIDGGVDLNRMLPGEQLDVETHYHVYRVIYEGDSDVTISGHPEICPDPIRVHLTGIYCRDLVLGLGTLHCMTQQQPE